MTCHSLANCAFYEVKKLLKLDKCSEVCCCWKIINVREVPGTPHHTRVQHITPALITFLCVLYSSHSSRYFQFYWSFNASAVRCCQTLVEVPVARATAEFFSNIIDKKKQQLTFLFGSVCMGVFGGGEDVRGHCKRNWWQKVGEAETGQRPGVVRPSLGLSPLPIEWKVNIHSGLQLYPGLNQYGLLLSINNSLFVKSPRAAVLFVHALKRKKEMICCFFFFALFARV